MSVLCCCDGTSRMTVLSLDLHVSSSKNVIRAASMMLIVIISGSACCCSSCHLLPNQPDENCDGHRSALICLRGSHMSGCPRSAPEFSLLPDLASGIIYRTTSHLLDLCIHSVTGWRRTCSREHIPNIHQLLLHPIVVLAVVFTT